MSITLPPEMAAPQIKGVAIPPQVTSMRDVAPMQAAESQTMLMSVSVATPRAAPFVGASENLSLDSQTWETREPLFQEVPS